MHVYEFSLSSERYDKSCNQILWSHIFMYKVKLTSSIYIWPKLKPTVTSINIQGEFLNIYYKLEPKWT